MFGTHENTKTPLRR